MNGRFRTKCVTHFAALTILSALLVATVSRQRVASAQNADDVLAPTTVDYVFSNNASIAIPEGGAANPYPSVINVSNVPTQLAKVTVRLNQLGHTFPSDIDILLVGPQGQTAMIMSDVGGANAINGVTLLLDDAATTPIPLGGPLVSGTYIPNNSGLSDPMPAPAPTQAGASALSVFQGTNPNGEWRLFVFDDVAIDGGSIASGWTLTLTAAISGQNSASIRIPESGVASPYPSEINVADQLNLVSRVQVNLINFTHASPDDVDVLLVSPSGRSVVLMSDVGGSNAVTGLNISFDDGAPALPDSGPLVSGLFRPTDFEPGDTFPAPAPAGPPTGRTLSSLNGTVANGSWKLYVVDDAGNNVGSIDGGWSILVGTTAGTVSIAGSGIAAPYPSELAVNGLPGSITRATVTISNFSHIAPDDVDILLVAPDGRRIVLMSDAGGQTEAGGITLVFDDAAATAIPDTAPLFSGTYRPADYEPGETFPLPAPSGPATGTTLNTFYGGVPNGIWRLYVVGDGAGTFGSIAGEWSLNLTTSTSACLMSVSPMVQSIPVGGGNSTFNIIQPNGCSWTASTTDPFINILSSTNGGGNGSINYSVAANQGPARTGTIQISNGVTSRTFQIQQPSGCPLSVSTSEINLPAAGGNGSVNITAGPPCSWSGSTFANWIQFTSPQPQTGNGTLAFTVQPNNARSPRSATIDVGSMTINVNQAPSRATPFDFDGDHRTDFALFRPSTSTWWIMPSGGPQGTATANQFGLSSDRIVPADFDGDQKTDIAVYRDGTWYVLASLSSSVMINTWGTADDIPVPADYNGDGSTELTVYRPSTGTWWILNSNGSFSSTAFGLPTDVPTPGDYDGDGHTDLSVYRAATAPGERGTWWILNSTNGVVEHVEFGVTGDVPVANDFDGDGRDNIALYRPSTGVWFRSTNAAQNYHAVQWGLPGDKPVAGDYDGDGKSDPAVVRFGSSAVWYVLGSTSGAQTRPFGVAGDRPAPAAYLP